MCISYRSYVLRLVLHGRKVNSTPQITVGMSREALFRDVMEPAKIRIYWMRISCAKSVGCGFVARSKLVPSIIATAIQLSYLKLNSYKQTSSE